MSIGRCARLTLILCPLVALACTPRSPRANTVPERIPGVDLRVEDSIDALDFAVGADSLLHVAWTVSVGDSGHGRARRHQVWYQCGNTNTGAWRKPILLSTGDYRPDWGLRIVTWREQIHIIRAGKLTHFFSPDNGWNWREGSALLGPDQVIVPQFDVAVAGGVYVLATISPAQREGEDWTTSPIGVWTTRFSEARAEQPVRVATYTGRYYLRPSPRLIAGGSELHLVYGIIERGPTGTGATVGRLFHAKSKDQGRSWSTPSEISPLATPGATARGSNRPENITEIEIAQLRDSLVVLFNSGVLYATVSGNGQAWSPTVTVAEVADSLRSGSYGTSSPSVAGSGRGGQLVWVDTRYRRSDRSAAMPLGGIPWSDNPDWMNNDVLALPLSVFASSPSAVSGIEPARVTDDLSYAKVVRARAAGKRIYVVWAGRAKVGKELDSYREPPGLFVTILPPE